MINFLRDIFHAPEASPAQDRKEMIEVSAAARARLAERGLLQVELDAQKEIKQRVKAAADQRDVREGASKAA